MYFNLVVFSIFSKLDNVIIAQTFGFFSLGNLAVQQSVWEDSPWRGRENWRANKAVDGRYNDRRADGGQCVISENYRNTATWRVDLGDIVSISHINIYYRTDNFPSKNTYILLNCR